MLDARDSQQTETRGGVHLGKWCIMRVATLEQSAMLGVQWLGNPSQDTLGGLGAHKLVVAPCQHVVIGLILEKMTFSGLSGAMCAICCAPVSGPNCELRFFGYFS